MPQYQYDARDARGKAVRGTLHARDEAQVLATVKAQGLLLITCRPIAPQATGQPLSARELSDFCRELGTMLSAGITLLRAIQIMQGRGMPRKWEPILSALVTGLLAGTALSDVMAQQGRAFPSLLINMLRAGEAGGSLDRAALRMADHYEKEHRLRGKMRSATAYPLLLLALTVVITLAVCTFVLPRFVGLYGDAELPGATRAVMAFSRLLTGHLPLVLLALAGLIAFCALALSRPAVRRQLDRLKLGLPVFGRLNRIVATARFARTLSSLYASGLTILTALEISRDTAGNAYIAGQFGSVIQAVSQGEPLSEALAQVDGFDSKLCATIRVGEESGRLEPMLLSVADSFDFEAAEAAGRMVSLLEPLCIIVMAAVIGFILIAALLPILDMYSTLDRADERLPAMARAIARLTARL